MEFTDVSLRAEHFGKLIPTTAELPVGTGLVVKPNFSQQKFLEFAHKKSLRNWYGLAEEPVLLANPWM
jgi:hypothetical protein